MAPTSRSILIIKVSGRVRSDAFKTGLGFWFNVIILNNFDLKQLYTNNITKALD